MVDNGIQLRSEIVGVIASSSNCNFCI